MTTGYTCIKKIIEFYCGQDDEIQEAIHDDLMDMIIEICEESDEHPIYSNTISSPGQPFMMPLTYASNHK